MIVRIEEVGVAPVDHRVQGPAVVIGRAPSCDVVVDRPFVSGRHLRILGGVVAHDLGSTNGSFLDGQPLERPEWIVGGRLTLGGDELTVSIVAHAAPEPPLEAPRAVDPTTAPIQLFESALSLDEPAPRAAEPAPPAAAALDPTPTPRPMPRSLPAPPVGDADPSLLARLIEHDAPSVAPDPNAPLADLFTVEAFRFLRDVETIVSRIAGELSGIRANETVLPRSADNVMRLLGDIRAQPDDTLARTRFLEHLTELRRWLVESYSAYQRASVRMVEDLRSSLGVLELSRSEPIPSVQRALGLQDMVLWKRAQKRLQDLTPDVIAERLDELARDAAREAFED